MSTNTCGCCAGIGGGAHAQTLTPASVVNRPGLPALLYRVGTHGSFFETMKARLASMTVEEPGATEGTGATYQPLRALTTRDPSDPAIALLDGWATVADVLTFYQERLANEGYLRTATERRSILELARLVGYTLRPGVASTVYLAYTLDEDRSTTPPKPTTSKIPKGSRVQSVPGPGENAQSFETAEDLEARSVWNNLQPRLTQPQRITTETTSLYLSGIATNLKPGDALLIDIEDGKPFLRYVAAVEAQADAARTMATLQPYVLPKTEGLSTLRGEERRGTNILVGPNVLPSSVLSTDLLMALSRPPPTQAASSVALDRSLAKALDEDRDTLPQVLTTLQPAIRTSLYSAWASPTVAEAQNARVYALRLKATPFGSNAPLQPVTNDRGIVIGHQEWPLAGWVTLGLELEPYDESKGIGASLVVKRDGLTQSARISLRDLPQDFTLGEDVVQVSAVSAGGDEPVLLGYAFEFQSLGHRIHVTLPANRATTVTVDSDPERTLQVGQTVRYAADSRQVVLQFSRETGTVSAELTAPLASATPDAIDLDASYDQLLPDGDERPSWAVILRSDRNQPIVTRIKAVQGLSKAQYGITGKSSRLILASAWLTNTDLWLSVARGATVLAQSEELVLAEQPFQPDSTGTPADVKDQTVELAQLYDGLQSGRWIIVSGERTDVAGSTGVQASELAMISGVSQMARSLPGEKVHSMLVFAKPLAYSYKRSTVSVYGNVVKATHGETHTEVLGNGDGGKALQNFTLKQTPLTYVPAATPSGVTSTLQAYVNDVEWHEAETLVGLGPKDRSFVTQTDDQAKTTLVFGNGREGARVPTGVENVKAVYRNGIGKGGNVKAEQISLLQTRPLNVKAVVNPLPASGGADAESRDQARENAPLAVTALDRLVSVQDYADFARTFAGIAKAAARQLSDGRRQLVHLTIAGLDDATIDTTSDLYTCLLKALRDYGDPDLPVQVEMRELVVLVLSAKLQLAPDYQWEPVVTKVRAALLDGFGFQRRALGQPVFLSEITSTIQNIEGVAYVDIDAFGGIPEKIAGEDGTRRLLTADELARAMQYIASQDPYRKGCVGPALIERELNPPKAPKARRGGEKENSSLVEEAQSSTAASSPQPFVDVSLADSNGAIRPAQLAIFTSAVADTLILNQITGVTS